MDERVRLAAIGFRETMMTIAFRLLWDIIFNLVQPCDETREQVLNEIKSFAVKEIRASLQEDMNSLDCEEIDRITRQSDEAITLAISSFNALFKEKICDGDMLDMIAYHINHNLPILSDRHEMKVVLKELNAEYDDGKGGSEDESTTPPT